MPESKKRVETIVKLFAALLLLVVAAETYYLFFFPKGRGGLIDTYVAKTPPRIRFLFSILGPGNRSSVQRFWRPLGVGTDAVGNCYVTDTNNRRVCVFDNAGRFIREFGTYGEAIPPGTVKSTWQGGQFAYPYGIAVSDNGRIYVADMLNGRVQYFTSRGRFIDFFPKQKSLDPKSAFHRTMLYPLNLTFHGDKVYVCDSFRVAVFDLDGKFIRSIGRGRLGTDPGYLNHPNGVAVGRDGTVYVSDSNNQRVQAFSPNNEVKWTAKGPYKQDDTDIYIGIPRGIAVDQKENILVVDATSNCIHIFSPKGKWLGQAGERGTDNGYFNFPNDIAVRPDGVIYVADKENNRIQAIRITY